MPYKDNHTPVETLNHTLIYMTLLIIGGILVLTDILLIVFRPDANATILSSTATLVTLAVTSVISLRQNRVTQQVAAQNNDAIAEVKQTVSNNTGEIAKIKNAVLPGEGQ